MHVRMPPVTLTEDTRGQMACVSQPLQSRMTMSEAPIGSIHHGRRWMTEQEISEHTKIPVATLRSWRRADAVRVLPFHRLGRLIRYDLEEVDAAIAGNRVDPD